MSDKSMRGGSCGPPRTFWPTARQKGRTIKPDDPEFDAVSLELTYGEEDATVISPLMQSRLPAVSTGR